MTDFLESNTDNLYRWWKSANPKTIHILSIGIFSLLYLLLSHHISCFTLSRSLFYFCGFGCTRGGLSYLPRCISTVIIVSFDSSDVQDDLLRIPVVVIRQVVSISSRSIVRSIVRSLMVCRNNRTHSVVLKAMNRLET